MNSDCLCNLPWWLKSKNLASPLAFYYIFDFPSVKSKRKSLRQLSKWTKIMLSNLSPSEVPHKCKLLLLYCFLPFLAQSHLWEISIHVLLCNGWICDKFKELPHSHHSNTALQKEICQKENINDSFSREKVIIPTILQRNKEMKIYMFPENSV